MKKYDLDYIYKSYMKDVYRYLLSLSNNIHITEDLLQETFFRAYLHFEDCPHNNVKPWLFRVAYNAYIDFIRKNNRCYAKESDFFINITDSKTPENTMLLKEQFKEISYLIHKMPEKQKQAILLCDFNDLSYKEASEIMGVSLSYFKILLFRARQIIRNKVERIDNFE